MPKINELKLGHEIGKNPPFMRFIWATCIKCNTPRWVPYIKCKDAPKSLLCMSCGHGKPKGFGRGHYDKDGYILKSLPWEHPYITMANKRGWILEHRLVMAQHLGRNLLRSEHVHHLNGVRDDNRIENLAMMSMTEHLHCHTGGTYSQRIQDLERTVKVLEARIKILESNTESPQADCYFETCGGQVLC